MITGDAAVVARTGTVEEQPFFDQHADELHELFVALDREAEWRDSPEELLPYTQELWVGQDHGNGAEKDQFEPGQEAAAMAVMQRLGFSREILPQPGDYEQIVIVGGLMRVNRERLAFARQLLETRDVETSRLVFWAGQRLRDARDDAQLDDMDIAGLSADGWVRGELAKDGTADWRGRFATETELARLAYLESFGPVQAVMGRAADAADGGRTEGVPDRQVSSYTFLAPDRPRFKLMNCAAVERTGGSPRHTTRSCAAEWLEETPPSDGARVLVVAGNPHGLRNLRDIRSVARSAGRPDVDLSVCGPAADPDASIQLYLGEIGRLLYMDAADAEAGQESAEVSA